MLNADLIRRLGLFLSEFFGLRMEPLAGPAERVQNVHTSAAIGSVVGLLFAGFNYRYADMAVLAAIEALAVVLLVLPAWAMGRFPALVSAAESMVLCAALIISFALLISGGERNTGHLWLYLFPFLAFFLKGQRRGWYFSLLFLALLGGYFASLHQTLSFAYRYDTVFISMLILSVLFYTLIASAFNLLRTRFETQLQARVEERTAAAQSYLSQLQYQASHDTLTGLPNRPHLLELIAGIVERCESTGAGFAVCNIRVERLFEFGNVLGVDGADELIRQVAAHLRNEVGEDALLARTRRDEFVVVRTLGSAPQPGSDLSGLLVPAHASASVLGYSLHIAFLQGVSLFPAFGREPELLVHQAEQAMLQSGKNGQSWALYDAELEAKFVRHHLLFGKLRTAIPAGNLRVHFQPQIDLASGRLVGAEALSRWQDPEEGNIPPDVFIPVAEDSGLIRPLTHWLVGATLAEAERWQAAGLDITVSINISALGLLDPELLAMLRDIARRGVVPARKIMLELTESCFLGSIEATRSVMQRLHDEGFHLSIDDYGTGFSSLSYLKHLPIAELKIDQGFVRHLLETPGDQAIVESTIALAHNFRLKVVAEGVENPVLADWLRERRCDIGQGYGFARPLPPDDFFAFAQANLAAHPNSDPIAP